MSREPTLLCPAYSPESHQRCVLPFTKEAHRAGHESAYKNNVRAVWALTVGEDELLEALWDALQEEPDK